METSFQAKGSILGTDVMETGTYCTIVRPDGTLFGEGQGIVTTADGKLSTWTGHGVGSMPIQCARDECLRVEFVPDSAPNDRYEVGGRTSYGIEVSYDISKRTLKIVKTSFAR
jgi:hypothetical protein